MSMNTHAEADDETYSIPSEPSAELIPDGLQEGGYTIPDSLLDREIWLCYQITDDEERKVPKQAREDGHICNIDPTLNEGAAGLSTYYEALGAIKASKANCAGDFDSCLDGVGLTLGELKDGRTLAGFDLDDCIVQREIEQWARTLVESMETYAELSPSRTGLHVLFYGELDDELQNRTSIPGDTDSHLEVYDGSGGRYFTFSGRALECAPNDAREREDVAREIHRRWFDEHSNDTDSTTLKDVDATPSTSGLTEDDAKLLAKIRAADDSFQPLWQGRISGYQSHSEADLALCTKLSFHCRVRGHTDTERVVRLFEHSALVRDKWYDRQDYREQTLRAAHFSSFD